MFDLHGKIALVTGASGGIGAEIAKALHAQGATVVLHGTRAEKLESLKLELGERAFVVTANVDVKTLIGGPFACLAQMPFAGKPCLVTGFLQ